LYVIYFEHLLVGNIWLNQFLYLIQVSSTLRICALQGFLF